MNSKKTYLVFALLYFPLIWIASPRSCHSWDTWCFSTWTKHINQYGLGHAYWSPTDYPPIIQYLLWIFSWFMESDRNIEMNIHNIKVFSYIFHIVGGYFILRALLRENISPQQAFTGTLCYVLNFAVLYNAYAWNQVDIILGVLVFIAVIFAVWEKPFTSLILLVIGLNFKVQALIYIPVLGLIVLPQLLLSGGWKKFALALLCLAGTQVAILLPFNFDTLHRIWEITVDSFGKFAVISARAYNIWPLFMEGDLMKRSDKEIVFGLTYNAWGLIMFLAASFMAMWPLLKVTFLSFKTGVLQKLTTTQLMLIGALIPILFFYLNTQMHDRYSHPTFLFLVTYAVLARRPFPVVFISIAYFLNLEKELNYLNWSNYEVFIFNEKLVSCFYLVSILMLYYDLYFLKRIRQPIPIQPQEPAFAG